MGLVVLSISLYFLLGNSQGLQQYYLLKQHDKITQQLLDELQTPTAVIARLQQQLQKTPNSAEGWYLLGRLYFSMRQYHAATASFARAYGLKKQDDAIAIQYAEALFFANQKQVTSQIDQLLQQVLHHHANNESAINLLALIAYQQQHYQQAIHYWEQLLPLHSPRSEDGQALLGAIADAEQKLAQHP